MHPDLEEIGRRGAYYLLSGGDWVKRHVETVNILDQLVARRRLTVDIELPRAPHAAIRSDGDEWLYYVPLTTLKKRLAATFLDLRDEDSRALPLRTRAENGRISAIALNTAVTYMLGRRPGPALRSVLDLLAVRDREVGFAAGVLARVRSEDEADLSLHASWSRLQQMIEEIALNQVLWIPLTGAPGSRRVIKFAYEVSWRGGDDVGAPVQYRLVRPAGSSDFFVVPEPPPRPQRLQRGLEALGWRAVQFEVDRPALLDAESYHLQVHAPPGLEPRDIALRPRDEDQPKLEPQCIVRPTAAALHIPGRVLYEGAAVVPLRVETRGFLLISLISTSLISLLLWGYAWQGDPTYEPEVAAGVLLVVPALLTGVAIRPGEHPLSSAVLTGVRLSVLGTGVLASAAAAAIAGVHLSSWTAEEAWAWYAHASLLFVGVVAVSYVLALPAWHGAISRAGGAGASSLLAAAGMTALAAFGILWLLVDGLAWVRDEPVHAAVAASLPIAGMAGVIGVGSRLEGGPSKTALIVWLLTLAAVIFAAVGTIATGPDPATLTHSRDATLGLAVAFGVAALLARLDFRGGASAPTPN